MEAQVLQQDHLAAGGVVDGLLDLSTDTVLGEDNALAELLLQLGHHGLQGVLGVGLAIGTTQVGHQHDGLGAVVDSILDGGQSTDDTLGVGDLQVLVEGDIEVDLLNGMPLEVGARDEWSNQYTRIRTRLSLRSTSVMLSLLESDILGSLGGEGK